MKQLAMLAVFGLVIHGCSTKFKSDQDADDDVRPDAADAADGRGCLVHVGR